MTMQIVMIINLIATSLIVLKNLLLVHQVYSFRCLCMILKKSVQLRVHLHPAKDSGANYSHLSPLNL